MEQSIIKFLCEFNLQTIITLGFMMWMFTRHIDTKFDKFDKSLAVQSARSDKLYEELIASSEKLSDYRKEADRKFYSILKNKK
jgi:hypothetical protein